MYVDYSVEIDFINKLLPDYIEILKEAEDYDAAGNYGEYDNCVQSIDIGAKLMCEGGRISSYQWDTLMRRYRS